LGTDDILCSKEELIRQVKGKDALFCILDDRIDKDVIAAGAPSLKAIATMSVGYDHIDIKECEKRNILVGNTPGILTETTAELALALLMAASRRISEGVQAVKEGTWKHWRPMWLCGTDIFGSTVGIVGMGRIGSAFARRLKGFGCQIIYSGSQPKAYADELKAEFVDFQTLLKRSDFISVHCPLTDFTRGLFNEQAFNQMKSGAIFVNTSRGAVVDQNALYNALKSGRLAAAALDVTTPEPLPPSHPLLSLPNCIVTPHIGSATNATRDEMAVMTARNVIAGVHGRPMPYPVLPKPSK